MNEVRIAVTGGRDFSNKALVERVLGRLLGRDVILAHGDCKGADHLCRDFAIKAGWKVVSYPAQWDTHGHRAGPIRNAQLLDDFKPYWLMVFPGGKGTLSMVNLALDRKIRIVYSSSFATKETK